MEVLSINQNPIVNIELSRFFNMQGALFLVDAFEDVVDMVVHCCHSVEPFFCGRGGEFVVIIKLYSACIKAIVNSAGGEFMGSGGCGIIGKFRKR